MKSQHYALAAAFVITFVVVPAGAALMNLSTGAFVAASENVAAVPGPDTPWYAVGFMPVLLIGGGLAVMLAFVAFAARWARLRP